MNKNEKKLFDSALIYSRNATSKSKSRGTKIYDQGKVLKKYQFSNDTLIFRVKSQRLTPTYTVKLFLKNFEIVNSYCSCPYSWKGICKHTVAALKKCRTLITKNELNLETKISESNPKTKKEKQLHEQADLLLENHALRTVDKGNGYFEIKVKARDDDYFVMLRKDMDEKEVRSECACQEGKNGECVHKIAAKKYIYKRFGKNPFLENYNFDKQKEKLLQPYGFTLDDNWQEHFTFKIKNGVPELKPKSKDILNLSVFKNFSEIQAGKQEIEKIESKPEKRETHSLGFIVNNNNDGNLRLISIEAVFGTLTKNGNRFKGKLEPINFDLIPKKALPFIDDNVLELFDLIENINSSNLMDYIFQQFRSIYYIDIANTDLFEGNKELIAFIRLYWEKLNRLSKMLYNQQVYIFLTGNYKLTTRNIKKVNISNVPVETRLYINKDFSYYTITAKYFVGDEEIQINSNLLSYIWIVEHDLNVYFWKSMESLMMAILFFHKKREKILIPHSRFDILYKTFIQPLQNSITVELNIDFEVVDKKIEPQRIINLSETGKFLMFYPVMKYGEKEVLLTEKSEEIYEKTEKELIRIRRDIEAENSFKQIIADLHPKFNKETMQDYYYLNIDDVTKNFWFLSFFQKCKKNDIEIFGFNKLKKLKYNPNKPTTSLSIESGTDWFDLDVKITFGETVASLADIRKAILRKENMVKLSDDSIGILPGEWLEKWATALKFGDVDDKKLKLSKTHFSIIDVLFAQEYNDEKIAKELEEKRMLLNNFDEIEQLKIPKTVKAELRDYQKSGLNWLFFLTKFQWGGCLADDMGLGKTLQVLALFAYMKSKNRRGSITNLVVAPTSLLFNWKNEVEKFVPHLNVLVHWGPNRQKDSKEWSEKDIILTTYSIVTNDINIFKDYEFTCAVLDESQAIKNVAAQRYKAVMLIKAKNRFALTGTPIENNTLELFAQMQFLNPGMLGSFNFFRNEYSNAIDKGNEPEKAEELKKLIYPFILRRTKEQVAKDLPPKTEMVLYCEMESEQRSVYDTFKAEFRKHLLNKIDDEGMNKSRFLVLDALLKMRQICDSPALLNTEEDYGNTSIKIDELMRHITEKTGKHKVLVFSQFLKMLEMISARLSSEKIPFVRLDGSTRNRQEIVDKFQTDENCRVFIISLKAGGVGLNLTAADYVYLVDPWWNPAVETQAIDRTHRIGQTSHVFAYRMICKDTVEEKIMELQKRKKSIADEIVSSESSFVKKLTRDDIDALFS